MTEPPLLHDISESGRALGGLGRTAVYELVKRGEIQLVKIGRRSFITAESIRAYVDRISGERQSDPAPAA